MKKQLTFTIAALFISVLLISWGSTGHKKINYNTTLFFNQEMSQFVTWATSLQSHASDADDRKSTDPNEAPKHFIDIDAYADFNMYHRIPQTWDSIVAKHGQSYVISKGILPYATKTTFDTLVACFQRKNWNKAMLTSADLGHYVGDGHMPLHITQNYDGAMTNQSGIHSRYESSMISAHINDIIYTGDSISFIPNVTQYIFDYIYFDNKYVDSVLQADTYAKQIAGSTSGTAYTDALWLKTQYYTTMLFKNSSHALAELMYTAWVTAGSPTMTQAAIESFSTISKVKMQNFPNPFNNSIRIAYTLKKDMNNVTLEIKDITGKSIIILESEKKKAGTYQIDWIPQNVKEGVFFITLKSEDSFTSQKIVYTK